MEVSNHFEQKIMYEDLVTFKNHCELVDFSCVVFWNQNVSIPLEQSWSMLLERNVLILLVSNIYDGNIRTCWYKKLCMKT